MVAPALGNDRTDHMTRWTHPSKPEVSNFHGKAETGKHKKIDEHNKVSLAKGHNKHYT